MVDTIKLSNFALAKQKLPCGVMVARRILVPPVRVRILPRQHKKSLVTLTKLFFDNLLKNIKRGQLQKPGQQQKSVELLKYNGLVGAPVVRRPHIRMAYGKAIVKDHTGRSRTPWYRRPY